MVILRPRTLLFFCDVVDSWNIRYVGILEQDFFGY